MNTRALYTLLGLVAFCAANNALAGETQQVPMDLTVEEQGVVKELVQTILPEEESKTLEFFLLEPRSALLYPEKAVNFLGRLALRFPQTASLWPRLASYFLFSVDPKVPPVVQVGKSALTM